MTLNGTIFGAMALVASLALLAGCTGTTTCSPTWICEGEPEVPVTGSWVTVGRCDQPAVGAAPESSPGCPVGWEESCFRLLLALTEKRGKIEGTGVMIRTGRISMSCQETSDEAPIAVASGSRHGSGISLALDVGGLGLGRLAFEGTYLAQFGDGPIGHPNTNVLVGSLTGAGFDRAVFLNRTYESGPSSRTKDLVDMALIAESHTIDGPALKEALE